MGRTAPLQDFSAGLMGLGSRTGREPLLDHPVCPQLLTSRFATANITAIATAAAATSTAYRPGLSDGDPAALSAPADPAPGPASSAAVCHRDGAGDGDGDDASRRSDRAGSGGDYFSSDDPAAGDRSRGSANRK